MYIQLLLNYLHFIGLPLPLLTVKMMRNGLKSLIEDLRIVTAVALPTTPALPTRAGAPVCVPHFSDAAADD